MGILTTLPQQIETERLIIRTARPGDGAVFNAGIHASMERLAPWLVWVTPPPTVEESEESCRLAHGRFFRNEDLMALVFRKECGSLVGGSGLHDADWKAGKFEIGYLGARCVQWLRLHHGSRACSGGPCSGEAGGEPGVPHHG